MLTFNYLFNKRFGQLCTSCAILVLSVPVFGQNNFDELLRDSVYIQLYNSCLSDAETASSLDIDCFAEALQKKFPADQGAQVTGTVFAMVKLERAFDLKGAVAITKVTLQLGQQMDNPQVIADAYQDLFRFEDARGNRVVSTDYLEKATATWKKIGQQKQVLRNQFMQLERRAQFQSVDSIYREMLLLFERAEKIDQHEGLVAYLNNRMVIFTQNNDLMEDSERHLDALAAIPVSDPVRASQYGNVIIHARGRANLAFSRGQFRESREWYRTALALCREQPAPYLEIATLLELAKLKIQTEEYPEAYSFLDTAEVLAFEREIYDLLADVFDVRVATAEARGDYQSALEFMRKEREYRDVFERRSAGFDVENYFLEQEKEELSLQKDRQALALKEQRSLLRLSWGVGVLAILMVLVTVWGLISQRRKRKQLAEQNKVIQEQAERLSKLDALKSQFFANASHELRTPLGLMLGPLKTLRREGSLSDSENQLVGIANKAGQQMNRLINDILDLTKMDNHHLTITTEPTELGAFLAAQCHPWLESARQQGKSFAYDIRVPAHLQVALDRRKLQQVMNNLLSNAFKFTVSGDSVTVEAQELAGQLVLSVEDTGSGIKTEDLPYIFDRYFQSNDPKRVTVGGSGIGLALTRELAELMGGTVDVQSTPDKGSLFRLALPLSKLSGVLEPSGKKETLQRAYHHGELARENQVGQGDAHRPAILIVDDNADLRQYLKLILQTAYHLHLVTNGQEALDHLRDHKRLPDLILTDLMMPVMDGFGLIEAVKSEPRLRHLPVIMLTAKAQARTKLRALRIGVDDYLTMPFDEQELQARIQNILAHQSARRAEVTKTDRADVSPQTSGSLEHLSEADQQWLADFEAFAKKNMGEGTFNVPRLAQEFAMSESTLLRQLKRLTGLTPVKYVQELRLDMARELMEENGEVSVQKVASEIGYQDVRSFSRIFKKRFGVSPSEYMQSN